MGSCNSKQNNEIQELLVQKLLVQKSEIDCKLIKLRCKHIALLRDFKEEFSDEYLKMQSEILSLEFQKCEIIEELLSLGSQSY
jgi:hypothetical protein